MKPVAALFLLLSFVVGCGSTITISGGLCFITAVKVSPQTATVDHTAAPPGNSQQFAVFQIGAPDGCAITAANLQNAAWSVSDTVTATISSSHDQNNTDYGRATCMNSSPSPITVTAIVPSDVGSNVTGTAQLMCQ